MGTTTDDRWIETLAGRSAPDDGPTRQAARARAVLEARLRHEVDGIPDPHAEARWLARLAQSAAQRRREFEEEERQALTRTVHRRAGARWWQRLPSPDRWVPRGGGFGSPVAAAVALLVGVGVVLLPLQFTGPDDQIEKALGRAPATSIDARVIISARPLDAAIELRDAMRASGVGSLLLELGDTTRLEVDPVSDTALAEVRRLLAARGIEWSGAERLALEFRSGQNP